jgi:hypothetical protein
VSIFHPFGPRLPRHGPQRKGVMTAEGRVVTVDFAELNDDCTITELDESLVASEAVVELAAPMRHFHRPVKTRTRTLSSGPLANPRRTRLV